MPEPLLLHPKPFRDTSIHLPTQEVKDTIMSAPSGIKVPQSLSAAFSTALNGGEDVRALVFVIEGGESMCIGIPVCIQRYCIPELLDAYYAV